MASARRRRKCARPSSLAPHPHDQEALQLNFLPASFTGWSCYGSKARLHLGVVGGRLLVQVFAELPSEVYDLFDRDQNGIVDMMELVIEKLCTA